MIYIYIRPYIYIYIYVYMFIYIYIYIYIHTITVYLASFLHYHIQGCPCFGSPNPVSVHVFGDRVLTFGEGIPELDCLVPAARHNLAVVSREGDAEDVLSVTFEFVSIDRLIKPRV